MSFNSVVGQEKPINHLIKTIRDEKISSSYIFNGKEGVGKKKIAIEFAKCINCLNVKEKDQSCDKCSLCKKIDLNCCPDIKIIKPEKDSLKIGQIREFRNEIYVKPFECKKKVYIFENAEALTIEAANCLLKIIEEPPEYAIIILICSNIQSILPTILSRCQVIFFGELSTMEIEKILLKNNNLSKNKINIISKIARGSIGNAYNMIDDHDFLIRRDRLFNQLTKIVPGEIDIEMLNRVEKIFSEINEAKEIIEMIILWYRDLLLLKVVNNQKYIVNEDWVKMLSEKAILYRKTMLIDILNYLLLAQEYLKRNANKNILLESLVIKLSGVVY